jgi:hypothetical protein
MDFHILLFGIGEWIETNPGAVVLILTLIGGNLAGYARLEYLARTTREDLDAMMEEVKHHTGNGEVHVNQLYISTLRDRLGSVEEDLKGMRKEMNAGHKEIVDRIDSKFEALAVRMNR